jgi:hypothetical protein
MFEELDVLSEGLESPEIESLSWKSQMIFDKTNKNFLTELFFSFDL